MSPVHKLSAMGGINSTKVDYPSMLAGYGDFGAMQRIATFTFTNSTSTGAGLGNIPQTFQDLLIVMNYSTTVSLAPAITLNNGASFNYSMTSLVGNGSLASSSRITNYPFGLFSQQGCGTTTPNTAIMHILNYTNSSTFKTAIVRNAMDKNGSGTTDIMAQLFATTAPITQISISTANGGHFFNSGSTVAIYGIKASAA